MAAAHLSGQPCAGVSALYTILQDSERPLWPVTDASQKQELDTVESIQPCVSALYRCRHSTPVWFHAHTHQAFSYRQQCWLRIHARFCTPHHCANFKICCYVPESIRVCSIMHCAICGFWPESCSESCFFALVMTSNALFCRVLN